MAGAGHRAPTPADDMVAVVGTALLKRSAMTAIEAEWTNLAGKQLIFSWLIYVPFEPNNIRKMGMSKLSKLS